MTLLHCVTKCNVLTTLHLGWLNNLLKYFRKKSIGRLSVLFVIRSLPKPPVISTSSICDIYMCLIGLLCLSVNIYTFYSFCSFINILSSLLDMYFTQPLHLNEGMTPWKCVPCLIQKSDSSQAKIRIIIYTFNSIQTNEL